MGGTQYKPGALVVLYNSLLPVFGEITDILVFNVDECYFIIQEYETEYFSYTPYLRRKFVVVC